MNQQLHPHVAALMKKYARDLAQVSPSDTLDARIDRLVAAPPRRVAPRPMRRWQRPMTWAAAASLAVLAISAGIIIGMRIERSREVATAGTLAREAAQPVAWAPGDLGMWPSDSVALTIPAEYSAQGTLVAVNPENKSTGKRYWIDVVVSNDGTVRIDRVVPADAPGTAQQADEHVQKSQIQ
jgi:hypothetical protein